MAFGLLINEKHFLLNRFSRRGDGSDGNANGIVQELIAQRDNFFGHGSRKEECLTLCWEFGNNFFHIVNEAHVQHAIGLIQNKVGQVSKIDKALIHQVEESTGCSCEQIDTPSKSICLGLLAHSAKNNGVAQRDIGAIGSDALVYLKREFTGRGEDQYPNGSFPRMIRNGHQVLKDGQRKGSRLSSARLCRAQ